MGDNGRLPVSGRRGSSVLPVGGYNSPPPGEEKVVSKEEEVVVSKEGMVSNDGDKIGMAFVIVQVRIKRKIRGEKWVVCDIFVNCF